MADIVNELAKLNQRDLLDIISVFVPIALSVLVIWQNKIYEHRNVELQKRMHNREWSQQYHDDILLIYNTYYEFCDVIFNSGFSYNVEIGYVNAAVAWTNQLQTLKMNILRRNNLAKLLFQKKNAEMFNAIDACFKKENDIIDKYIAYISSGRLFEVSENAWNRINQNPLTRYNYSALHQDQNTFRDFSKLCESDELQEIKNLLIDDEKLHEYNNYDRFFEEYFAVDKLD